MPFPMHGVIQAPKYSLTCKLCVDFYTAKAETFRKDPTLRKIYDEHFKHDEERRRAFIVRSHAVRRAPGHTTRWFQEELQAMRREHNLSKGKAHPDFVDLPVMMKDVPDKPTILHGNITDGPSVHRNDTGTDMNPVVTFTQEHPHCQLAR